jgi:hypothetical protein|tara:strand:+ start:203 stop:625 length:423 start_codon:yes stop_codon:yes gene_type:complete
MTKGSSLNLVYGIEYYDEDDMEYFYIFNTIFRNVPLSQLNRLNNKEFKKRIKTYCDKHYIESAVNATGSTIVEMIHGDKYYETYEDVFGDVAEFDNSLFNDYGQLWNGRQFFKYDFAPELTKQYEHKHLNKKYGGYKYDN